MSSSYINTNFDHGASSAAPAAAKAKYTHYPQFPCKVTAGKNYYSSIDMLSVDERSHYDRLRLMGVENNALRIPAINLAALLQSKHPGFKIFEKNASVHIIVPNEATFNAIYSSVIELHVEDAPSLLPLKLTSGKSQNSAPKYPSLLTVRRAFTEAVKKFTSLPLRRQDTEYRPSLLPGR